MELGSQTTARESSLVTNPTAELYITVMSSRDGRPGVGCVRPWRYSFALLLVFGLFVLGSVGHDHDPTISKGRRIDERMPAGLGQKLKNLFHPREFQQRQSRNTKRDAFSIAVGQHKISLSDSRDGGTYPRLARLSDGTILASVARSDGDERVISVSRSSDEGRTFVDIGEVTRGKGDIDNAYLLEISPSTILAAFRNHDLAHDGAHKYFRITVCVSHDGGKSWKYLSQAAEKGAPLGLWEPIMRLGKKGEVQLAYSKEFASNDQRSMLVVSHDEGASWSKPDTIARANKPLRDGMVGFASTLDEDRGEALVMVFETTRHGTFSVETALSYDDGKTWRDRQEVYAPRSGHNAGAPQIASFADGTLAVVFMTDEDSTKVDWVKHAAIKMVIAAPPKKGNLSWSEPVQLSKESSYWPGIMALDDRTMKVVYEHHGPFGRFITW